MFTTCTHTLESGSTCKSPAVRGTSLCFHHTPHQSIKRQFPHEYEPFELPDLSDKCGVLVAITEVLNRLAQQRIRRSDAGRLLEGLKFMSRLMTEIEKGAEPYCSFDENEESITPNAASPLPPAPTQHPVSPHLDPSFDQMLDSLAASAAAQPPAPHSTNKRVTSTGARSEAQGVAEKPQVAHQFFPSDLNLVAEHEHKRSTANPIP